MTTRDKAYEWIDAHKDDMVDLWKQMVTIDSGIGVKEGGMEMGNLCAGILEKLGFSIRRVSYEKMRRHDHRRTRRPVQTIHDPHGSHGYGILQRRT